MLPFQRRFVELSETQRDVYLVMVCFAAAATALIIAPVNYHRLAIGELAARPPSTVSTAPIGVLHPSPIHEGARSMADQRDIVEVLAHDHREVEELFLQLQQHATVDALRELGGKVEQAKMVAPTPPHPAAPDIPPLTRSWARAPVSSTGCAKSSADEDSKEFR